MNFIMNWSWLDRGFNESTMVRSMCQSRENKNMASAWRNGYSSSDFPLNFPLPGSSWKSVCQRGWRFTATWRVSLLLAATYWLRPVLCVSNAAGWHVDMIRVAEGTTGRSTKPKPSQRSTLTSVLQYLGESHQGSIAADLIFLQGKWDKQWQGCAVLFQSHVQPPMSSALIVHLGCRSNHHAGFFLPCQATAHLACWENAATTIAAGWTLREEQTHWDKVLTRNTSTQTFLYYPFSVAKYNYFNTHFCLLLLQKIRVTL